MLFINNKIREWKIKGTNFIGVRIECLKINWISDKKIRIQGSWETPGSMGSLAMESTLKADIPPKKNYILDLGLGWHPDQKPKSI